MRAQIESSLTQLLRDVFANQFNLTTRRYTETDVARMEERFQMPGDSATA
jgi:predicted enzyme involved in methoxymalonyl-ACP biosynthesis